MTYPNIKRGIFRSRPNRFIAYVEIDGRTETCHVKNTGRCRELLIEGVSVIVTRSENPARKTAYDLIAVYKGEKLINIDSQAPNQVMGEWLRDGGLGTELICIKPEYTFGSSRFDFYLETPTRRILAEVKGVTLEQDGVVLFPDAPTERGVKHLRELMEAKRRGYGACIFFVIQMEDCRSFTPNRETHPAFADALAEAAACGVEIRALNCRVSESSLTVDREIPVHL